MKAAVPSTFLLESDSLIIKKEISDDMFRKMSDEECLIYDALDFQNLTIKESFLAGSKKFGKYFREKNIEKWCHQEKITLYRKEDYCLYPFLNGETLKKDKKPYLVVILSD